MKSILSLIASPFKPAPSANEIRERNLLEYERSLVNSEEAAAYHGKMAEYYREGIARLKNQLGHDQPVFDDKTSPGRAAARTLYAA
jgi:hypothetical protein